MSGLLWRHDCRERSRKRQLGAPGHAFPRLRAPAGPELTLSIYLMRAELQERRAALETGH